MVEEVKITQGVDKSSATPSVDQGVTPENTEEEKLSNLEKNIDKESEATFFLNRSETGYMS